MSQPTRRTRVLLTATGAIVLAVGGAVLFAHSGLYNVAATAPHTPPVEWLFRTTMEHSVRARARHITVPEGLNFQDRALAEEAFGHYSAACRTCHSAPGLKPDPWVYIYPPAPDLTRAEVVGHWRDAELYWIIKHRIKDTGMLALGSTHPEDALWAVTAFVRQLPTMTPEEYQAMAQRYEAKQKARASGAPSAAGRGMKPSGPEAQP